ncbi:MAG: hypothetical protein UHY58_02195, partial [Alistipes sp.]|nr:hypothetical protein [Alistipes sp.]
MAAATLLLASCSVHEWPYEEVEPELPTYPITLHLNYLTELPQYVIVDYEVSRSDNQIGEVAEPAHDRRYTLEIYKIINEYTSKKELVLRHRFAEDELNAIATKLVKDNAKSLESYGGWYYNAPVDMVSISDVDTSRLTVGTYLLAGYV